MSEIRLVLASLISLVVGGAIVSCATQARSQAANDGSGDVDANLALDVRPSPPTFATTAPSEEPSAAAAKRIRELIAAGPLVFSTDPAVGTHKFHFQVWIASQVTPLATSSMDVFVSSDGRHVGMLVGSGAGRPYSYLSDGMLVIVDHERKGGLAIYTGGAPRLVLGLTPGNSKLNFELQFNADAIKPDVNVNLASLLDQTVRTMQSGVVDDAKHSIRVQTPNSVVKIGLPAKSQRGALPLTSFVIRNNVQGVALAMLNLAERQPPDLDLLKVDERSVVNLGVPLRIVSRAEAMQVGLTVPPDFGTDAAEREASSRLWTLFLHERQEHRSERQADSAVEGNERSEQWPMM